MKLIKDRPDEVERGRETAKQLAEQTAALEASEAAAERRRQLAEEHHHKEIWTKDPHGGSHRKVREVEIHREREREWEEGGGVLAIDRWPSIDSNL